jgi:hypothetical protein
LAELFLCIKERKKINHAGSEKLLPTLINEDDHNGTVKNLHCRKEERTP